MTDPVSSIRNLGPAMEAAFAEMEGQTPAMWFGVWDPDKGTYLSAVGNATEPVLPNQPNVLKSLCSAKPSSLSIIRRWVAPTWWQTLASHPCPVACDARNCSKVLAPTAIPACSNCSESVCIKGCMLLPA